MARSENAVPATSGSERGIRSVARLLWPAGPARHFRRPAQRRRWPLKASHGRDPLRGSRVPQSLEQ